MKVKITERAVICQYGTLMSGQELDDSKYPLSFLYHLVNQAKSAVIIEPEVRKEAPIIEKKQQTTKKRTTKKKRG